MQQKRIYLDDPVFSERLRHNDGAAEPVDQRAPSRARRMPKHVAPRYVALAPSRVEAAIATPVLKPASARPAKAQAHSALSFHERPLLVPDLVREEVAPQLSAKPKQTVEPQATTHFETLVSDQPRKPRRQLHLKQRVSRLLVLPKLTPFTRKNMLPRLLTGFAVLLLLSGGYVVISGYRTNKTVAAQVQQVAAQPQSNSGDEETDTNPTAKPETAPSRESIKAYQVSPDMPRFIRIPSIGVEARIRRMGIDKTGAVMAPASVFDAGWYDGSAKPGESGAAFIDGHVSGYASKGIFGNLKKLADGDRIEVEMGNGMKYTYKVANRRIYPKDSVDMNRVLTAEDKSKPGLNIMTCTGKFDAASKTFKDRLIVFAVRE